MLWHGHHSRGQVPAVPTLLPTLVVFRACSACLPCRAMTQRRSFVTSVVATENRGHRGSRRSLELLARAVADPQREDSGPAFMKALPVASLAIANYSH